MRLVSPNQFIRRQAREDVALGDQPIRAGDTLLLILAAANRDPKAFPDPDRFVFNRPEYLAASLQGMMTIFMVRRVRATAMGLAPAG
jgi:cytochrome P450